MKSLALAALVATAVISLPLTAHAAPIGVDGQYGVEWTGVTPVSIAGGSVDNGNFGSPDANGNVPYQIYVRDDGNYFYVLLTSTDPNAGSADFSNLYLDTIASTPNSGSNLGFELLNGDAFRPGVSGSTVFPSAADLIVASSLVGGTYGIEAAISNSFFLTDPLGMGFAKTPNNTLVSVHLSQSFGYGVVGGSANFAAPVELGDAIVGASAATPEPGSFALLGTGILGAAGMLRKRFVA